MSRRSMLQLMRQWRPHVDRTDGFSLQEILWLIASLGLPSDEYSAAIAAGNGEGVCKG